MQALLILLHLSTHVFEDKKIDLLNSDFIYLPMPSMRRLTVLFDKGMLCSFW